MPSHYGNGNGKMNGKMNGNKKPMNGNGKKAPKAGKGSKAMAEKMRKLRALKKK